MWPAIFKTDGVRPSELHLPALRALFRQVHCTVDQGGFPYVPLLKAPFYYFIGQKPWDSQPQYKHVSAVSTAISAAVRGTAAAAAASPASSSKAAPKSRQRSSSVSSRK